MSYGLAQARYASDAATTVSPARLLTMLYDRLVTDLGAAHEAMLRAGLGGQRQPALQRLRDPPGAARDPRPRSSGPRARGSPSSTCGWSASSCRPACGTSPSGWPTAASSSCRCATPGARRGPARREPACGRTPGRRRVTAAAGGSPHPGLAGLPGRRRGRRARRRAAGPRPGRRPGRPRRAPARPHPRRPARPGPPPWSPAADEVLAVLAAATTTVERRRDAAAASLAALAGRSTAGAGAAATPTAPPSTSWADRRPARGPSEDPRALKNRPRRPDVQPEHGLLTSATDRAHPPEGPPRCPRAPLDRGSVLMLEDVSIDALQSAMHGLSARQRAISGDIANVNTPFYRAHDVAFEADLQRALDDGSDPLGRRPHHHALRGPRRAERQQRRPHRRDDGERQDRAGLPAGAARRGRPVLPLPHGDRGVLTRVRRPRHQRLRHARPPDLDGRDLRQHRQRQHRAPGRAAGVPGPLRRRAGRRERRAPAPASRSGASSSAAPPAGSSTPPATRTPTPRATSACPTSTSASR